MLETNYSLWVTLLHEKIAQICNKYKSIAQGIN